jgi:hypothetical protein
MEFQKPYISVNGKNMKTLNLFFDFEFTSLSPDAQPISVGIVSDEIPNISDAFEKAEFEYWFKQEPKGKHSKSLYCEFSDFDINRCDHWVKENVVSKLILEKGDVVRDDNGWQSKASFYFIKDVLKEWLKQLSDYQIQFVCDCGTWDWYWMVQLLAEWEVNRLTRIKNPFNFSWLSEEQRKKLLIEYKKELEEYWPDSKFELIDKSIISNIPGFKIGLPKLPGNISPVPFDLNDLIAIKKGITPKEAFDIDRESSSISKDMLLFLTKNEAEVYDRLTNNSTNKHNSLDDALVIKKIYNKLK